MPLLVLLGVLGQGWSGSQDTIPQDPAPNTPLPAEAQPVLTEDQAWAQVLACYDAALVQEPWLKGELVLEYTVVDGDVRDARVVRNTTSDAVGRCVLARTDHWRFGASGKRRVEKTFLLSPVSGPTTQEGTVVAATEPPRNPALVTSERAPQLGIEGTSSSALLLVSAEQHRLVGCMYQYSGEGQVELELSAMGATVARNTTGSPGLAACFRDAAAGMALAELAGTPHVTLSVAR
jgi:hypothetical protein